jgi:hypothetical protein
MPDVMLYCPKRNWFFLIDLVGSRGVIDKERHSELATLFAGSEAGLVYVTAFPNRSVMSRYLGEIAWETEVWVADAPSHLIHFNGSRFLGPYDG